MSKHITIRVRESAAQSLTRQGVEAAMKAHLDKCQCCERSQGERKMEDRKIVSYRVDEDLFNTYKKLGNPFQRIARAVEYEEGYCPVCGS